MQNLQCTLMPTTSGLLTKFSTEEFFRIKATSDHLRMSTSRNDLLNFIWTWSTILMTDPSAFVTILASFPHSSTSFHAEILLMSFIIGVTRQLTGVATWKSGSARLVAASFRKVFSDIFTTGHFLESSFQSFD